MLLDNPVLMNSNISSLAGLIWSVADQMQQNYLPFAGAKYILETNNTPQAYAWTRSVYALQPRGFFFLWAE